MRWVETQVTLNIYKSYDKDNECDVYRLWDYFFEIPRPKDVLEVHVKIGADWEEMYYNTKWGKSFDQEKHDGCWLKQKTSKYFHSRTGFREFKIRYLLKKVREN